jgi:hypothetical protein
MICLPDSYCNSCICSSSLSGLVCKSHSQNIQEALNLLVREERCWALFYMPLYMFIHNLLNVLVQKTKLRDLSSRANYTDRATVSCRQVSAKFCGLRVLRGEHDGSLRPYSRFSSSYFFFQVSPQLFSRGWVDPVPDPLLLRKSGGAGNGTRTSGSVTWSSIHYTTEAVEFWSPFIIYFIINKNGAGIAQSVQQLATGWNTERS